MGDDSIDMGDDLKMSVSIWEMPVSIWKMTVSIWDILSLRPGPAGGYVSGSEMWRRKLNLKAEVDSSISHFSFKRLVPGGFNLGFIGSTCTALPRAHWMPPGHRGWRAPRRRSAWPEPPTQGAAPPQMSRIKCMLMVGNQISNACAW